MDSSSKLTHILLLNFPGNISHINHSLIDCSLFANGVVAVREATMCVCVCEHCLTKRNVICILKSDFNEIHKTNKHRHGRELESLKDRLKLAAHHRYNGTPDLGSKQTSIKEATKHNATTIKKPNRE